MKEQSHKCRSSSLVLMLFPALFLTQPCTECFGALTDGWTQTNEPVLSLEIRCDAKTLYAGDEIPITFTITNLGTNAYDYEDRNSDRSGQMRDYALTAFDETGKAVLDPRSRRQVPIMGGGSFGFGKLLPRKSFSRTITLNRWAFLTSPGKYRVFGTYGARVLKGRTITRSEVTSAPITVVILPRTDQEMATHIERLSRELEAACRNESSDREAPARLVRQLMYTGDRRIVPTLLRAMYASSCYSDNVHYWVAEAFWFYLPDEPGIAQALWEAARKQGLAGRTLEILENLGCLPEQIEPLIDVSLSSDNPCANAYGADAATRYPDDRFTSRLVSFTTNTPMQGQPLYHARRAAIWALAANRSDVSVTALQKLLNDPDQFVRQTTEDAVRWAYQSRFNRTYDLDLLDAQGNIRTNYPLPDRYRGAPFRDEDFDAKYRLPK